MWNGNIKTVDIDIKHFHDTRVDIVQALAVILEDI